jgi:hypothetical protein
LRYRVWASAASLCAWRSCGREKRGKERERKRRERATEREREGGRDGESAHARESSSCYERYCITGRNSQTSAAHNMAPVSILGHYIRSLLTQYYDSFDTILGPHNAAIQEASKDTDVSDFLPCGAHVT